MIENSVRLNRADKRMDLIEISMRFIISKLLGELVR